MIITILIESRDFIFKSGGWVFDMEGVDPWGFVRLSGGRSLDQGG